MKIKVSESYDYIYFDSAVRVIRKWTVSDPVDGDYEMCVVENKWGTKATVEVRELDRYSWDK